MSGKLVIKSDLEVVTGMHIRSFNLFSAIGAVDSVVVRDARTQLPIVPGSSLKGKLRILLQKSLKQARIENEPNFDEPIVKRLFGSSEKNNIKKSRLQFSDAFMVNAEELSDYGYTEVKFENSITRSTAIANPRQIERVVKGAKFGVEIIYDIEDENELKEDVKGLAKAMKLLHADYLGGHGTRGYGRVKFKNFRTSFVENTVSAEVAEELDKILKEVESYEI
ncbi:type III-A CRISPR-associated RAMP protein Csm3 [Bacillota bacterium]